MKSIRDRGGRTADNKPDRGIYVADGETLKSAPEEIAQREIAPSVANGIVPVPPPISMETKVDSKPKQNRMVSLSRYRQGSGVMSSSVG